MRFEFPIFVLAGLMFILRPFIKPRLVNIPTVTGSYEALAHMLVGFLVLVPWYDPHQTLGPSWTYAIVGWVISIWELGWFIAQKLKSNGA